jgi:hypothetical protein
LPVHFSRRVLGPAECRAIVPALASAPNRNAWVHRYEQPDHGWIFSIATHAEPGSNKLSLGGFRIAPDERTSLPGFDTDREAIELAMGMEEKVYWSRLIRAGGPLALRDSNRIVGGKCVLWPSPDARVGQPCDAALLDFAVACFRDFEATSGVYLTTGQDLGHGLMSDGRTQSLAYVNARFPGSVLADTSKPTGEGNVQLLLGVLRALEIPVRGARVGLIGYGNIGEYVLDALRARGADCAVLEANEGRRGQAMALGVPASPPAQKADFVARPFDAIVVNAAGGTLDAATVDRITKNRAVRVICGCENLALDDPADADRFRAAKQIYCPTELGGMMGYLTAAEEYLAHLEGTRFEAETIFAAAQRLDEAGYMATRRVLDGDFAQSFEDAVKDVYR